MANGACCCIRRWRARGGRPTNHTVEQIAAVEGEIEKAGQVEEERIGEVLRLVDHEQGRDAAFIHEVQERFLDRGPEFGAAMGGPEAELRGRRPDVLRQRRVEGTSLLSFLERFSEDQGVHERQWQTDTG
jgi:hypothetical protein